MACCMILASSCRKTSSEIFRLLGTAESVSISTISGDFFLKWLLQVFTAIVSRKLINFPVNLYC